MSEFSSPDPIRACTKCGAELPANGTNGLCPACLMQEAMKSTGGTVAKQQWEPPTAEELAKLLPQYEIEKLLGRGGMGAVYKGMQKSLERPVAIKILSAALEDSDAGFSNRFKNEARAMAKLSHPGIVGVFDSGETPDGMLYIVMEFIEGTDVAKMIAKQGRLHSEHAMAITAHVCDALAYAHERGIIHRDIKPANIMVGYDGVVKVADFGLAKVSNDNRSGLTQSGMAMGTLYYMAPEALMLGTSVDHRADIYAVGVMLYQMLTGKLPQGLFELPSLQVSGLDPRYDGIIGKALREDRELRYPSALEMRHDLDAILTQPVAKVEAAAAQAPAALPTQARPQRTGGQPYRPPQPQVIVRTEKQSSPLIWAAMIILAGLATWFYLKGGGDQTATETSSSASNSQASKPAPTDKTSVIANAATAPKEPVAKPTQIALTANSSTMTNVSPKTESAGNTHVPENSTSKSVIWLSPWRYTTNMPSGTWTAEDYDDRAWLSGDGPYGDPSNVSPERIKTHWATPNIWIRRKFDLPSGTPSSQLTLRCWFDGSGEIHLNNKLAARFSGWNGRQQFIPLSDESRASLKTGINVVTAYCNDHGKPQVLDVIVELDPATKHFASSSAITAQQLNAGVFLGDLKPVQPTMVSGKFTVNWYPASDAEIKEQNIRVLLGGRPCDYLFVHAPGRIVYDLPPAARRFTAWGLSATAVSTSPLMRRTWSYSVQVDGTTLFTSKPLYEYPNGEVEIDVSIPKGGRQLVLMTDSLGSASADHALWGNPMLHGDPAPPLPAGPKIWTDTKGRSITATFKRIEGTNVILDIAGKETPVPMINLSTESQKLALDHQRQLSASDVAPVAQKPAATSTKVTSKQEAVASLLSLGAKIRASENSSSASRVITNVSELPVPSHVSEVNLEAGRTIRLLNDDDLVLLATLPELRVLILSGQKKLTQKGIEKLGVLKSISNIQFDDTSLDDASVEWFASMTTLNVLSFGGTQITDKAVTTLGSRGNYVVLDFTNCAITDASVKLLGSFEQLKQLRLSGTKLTANAIADLRLALPSCNITHTQP